LDTNEVTFFEALAGRKLWIGAIGLGSLGVAELMARRILIALPFITLAFVLVSRARIKSGPNCVA
jgi:hypothetical protein